MLNPIGLRYPKMGKYENVPSLPKYASSSPSMQSLFVQSLLTTQRPKQFLLQLKNSTKNPTLNDTNPLVSNLA